MSQKSYDGSATLYLIPTPIGNMDDITYRAVKTLGEVEVVFCEDTRETGLLIHHLGLKKRLISNHEHNEKNNKDKIIEYLSKGFNIGLVSDRGTPIISDPGYELVKHVIDSGYNVVALPGATALIPALITSGITPAPFLFYGFLSSKSSKRNQELEKLKNETATMIFYESPHRLNDTINAMKTILGNNNRQISISREISKLHEEIYRGDLVGFENLLEIKGEIVIVVSGNNSNEDFSKISVEEHIELYVRDGVSKMDAIKQVAKERKIKKSDIYNEYLRNEGGRK